MMKSLKTLKPCFQENKQSQLLSKLIDSVRLSCELSFDQPRFFFGSMFRQHICKAYIYVENRDVLFRSIPVVVCFGRLPRACWDPL